MGPFSGDLGYVNGSPVRQPKATCLSWMCLTGLVAIRFGECQQRQLGRGRQGRPTRGRPEPPFGMD